MKKVFKVLIFNVDVADATLAIRELELAGMSCETCAVSTETDFTRQLEEFSPDVILAGLPPSDIDISTALNAARRHAPDTPFIIISDDIGQEKLEELMKSGVGDYVQKNSLARLPARVQRALREAHQRVQNEQQHKKISCLRRAMAIQSRINRAILHVRNQSELFQEACMITVEHGLFSMAWIGLAEPGLSKLMPSAWAGHEEGYLDDVALALANVAEDPGIGGRILRDKQMIVVNDLMADPRVIFKQEALARQYRSMIALPLILKGKIYAVFFIYSAEPNCFDDEEVLPLSALAGDISFALEYLDKTDQLHQLAYYDALTGLPNRQLVHDRLDHAISRARRRDVLLAVIFFDIDNLEHINHALGGDTRDTLLKIAANRLRSSARQSDTVAREGASQFVIVLEDQHNTDTASLAIRKIVSALSEAIVVEEHELVLTCSIGVSFFPHDGTDPDSLLQNASAAMSRAKQLGRNNVQYYARDISSRLAENLMLEGHLQRALERDELFIEYQAIIEVESRRIVGAEALLRWQHPELGLVPPVRFIPLAEDSGMIVPIGEWVLRAACKQNKTWQERGLPPVVVSVNLSARQFTQKDLVDVVINTLTETGLETKYLAIELTETQVVHDWESNVAKLQRLHDMGVQICVDDFGTGYSSLSYLTRLPVSRLKLDQSFVRNIAVNDNDAAIMKSMISLGHRLRLKVLAEGVETKEQLAFLRKCKCDEIQGYYFGKPMSPGMFVKALVAGHKK